MRKLTRRLVIAGAVTALGGGLVVASLPRARRELRAWRMAKPLGETAWLRMDPAGAVHVFCNVTEMGQGAVSGLLQGVAEELDIEWEAMRFEPAPVAAAYSAPWGYSTGGSRSVRGLLESYRQIGAAAREMLLATAADRWSVSVEECSTQPGEVLHANSGRRIAYGDLAADAARRRAPRSVGLRPASEWRHLGKSLQRVDTRQKVDGSALYGLDVALPGLRTATLMHAPVLGARLADVDTSPALAIQGVSHVVKLANAVAVVATGYWPARQGLLALAPRWEGGEAIDSEELERRLDALLEEPGDPATGSTKLAAELATSADVEARYGVPLLYQAPLEPMNATARMTADGGIEVWAPSQALSDAQFEIADALGLDRSKVIVHATLVGGGFGRRLANDYAIQAALIARETGLPIKLIWPRDEDIRHAPYRTMARARFRGRLDSDGLLDAIAMDVATLHSYRRVGGLDDMPYAVARVALNYRGMDTSVPIGSWRSVDMSQNTFFLECFLDECAVAARRDPLDYRAALLRHNPRALAVLAALRELARWDVPPAAGEARGMAFAEGFGSLVAQVVDVRSDGSAGFRVTGVHCVLDCGFAINPSSVEAQIQGGITYALSAALAERITIRAGSVVQGSFADYPLLRMPEAPAINVRILSDTARQPGGVGEPPVPLLAPALANAVARLNGVRPRTLPLRGVVPT
jgi:isoquinoline 1-oxidoreductase subunit beta